jgi:hypothetical protein
MKDFNLILLPIFLVTTINNFSTKNIKQIQNITNHFKENPEFRFNKTLLEPCRNECEKLSKIFFCYCDKTCQNNNDCCQLRNKKCNGFMGYIENR